MVTKVVIIVIFLRLGVHIGVGEEPPNVTVINHHHHHHHHHYIYRTMQAFVFFRNILSKNTSSENLETFPPNQLIKLGESMMKDEPDSRQKLLEERSENPISLDELEKAFTKESSNDIDMNQGHSLKRSVATLKFRRSTDHRIPIRATTEESSSRKRESKVKQMSAQNRPSVSNEQPEKPFFTVQKAPIPTTTSRTSTKKILIGMMRPIPNTRQPVKTKPPKLPNQSDEISIDRITEFGMAEQECSFGEFRGDDGECYSTMEF